LTLIDGPPDLGTGKTDFPSGQKEVQAEARISRRYREAMMTFSSVCIHVRQARMGIIQVAMVPATTFPNYVIPTQAGIKEFRGHQISTSVF
jgi:thiamine biosynthesis protein ThiC